MVQGSAVLLTLAIAVQTLQAVHTTLCPQGCACDEDTLVVSCERANLDVIPITLNPSIQRLGMRSNLVKTVDAAFQFYGELQYVDLADNHLVSIPVRAFEFQKKLLELHLDHNKISLVDNGTFHGLSSLTVLSLRGNYLMELGPRQFSVMPMLEELNLGQNRITMIDPKAFEGLSALRVLYLDDNQLRAVPTHAFLPLPRLAEIRVGLNAFSALEDGAFQGLMALSVLDLSGAGLVTINTTAFRGLEGLRSVNLADNKLTSVPTAALKTLGRLEELTIGQNPFTVLPADSFQGLKNLKKLDVSGAPLLERLENGALRDNANLESLILSSNKKLSSFEEGSLSGLPKLKHLSLKNNGLTTLSEDLVAWGDLRTAELADNPLHCTCALRWLPDLLLRWKAASPTLCVMPPQLRAQPLDGMPAEKLGCVRQLDTKQQALIAIVCGSGILLGAVIVLILYRCRHRIQVALKDYRWNKRAISRKEQEYHKTFSEEDYMVRIEQNKAIPVTEL